MNLLLIILFLILLSSIPIIFKKSYKLIIITSILIVLSFYFFISKNFFHIDNFYPKNTIQAYMPLGNYYNLLLKSFKNYKLYITDDTVLPALKDPNIYENYKYYALQNIDMYSLLDTSFYRGKIYLYFGITPVLLFYGPFNFITNLYLTDKIIIFVLACFCFLLSLFLVNKLSREIIDTTEISANIIILGIFFTGFCNFLPFLIIKDNIYEVAIVTAVFLLLLSFCIFYYYLNMKNTKKQYILSFCLSLVLCFAVGARPHYILFIPLFFILIVWLKYKETKSIKNILKSALVFLIPCLIYGTIIALYNYLRFDSIFEFGWKYQLNDLRQYDYTLLLKDSLLALKYNLFQIPKIDNNTIFSLIEACGHRIGNEFVVGVIWTFPLIFLFVLIPKFLIDTFKHNRKFFYIVILMLFVIFINLVITSFIGMVIRYFFEWMPFAIILSMILFFHLYVKIKTKFLKRITNIFFVIIFIYSIFMNVSLLFSKNNSLFYVSSSQNNYDKTINFLFNK